MVQRHALGRRVGGRLRRLGLLLDDLLFDDPRFWQSLEVTLVYAVASIGLGVAVGLAIAILVAGERKTEETLIRTTTEIKRLLDDIYDRRAK